MKTPDFVRFCCRRAGGRRAVWFSALLLGGALFSQAGENDWFVPLGPPPEAAKRRISGGESFPPAASARHAAAAHGTQARTERAQAGRKNRLGRGRLLHLRRRRANADRGLESLSGRLAAIDASRPASAWASLMARTVSAWPLSTAIRPRCRSFFSAACARSSFRRRNWICCGATCCAAG